MGNVGIPTTYRHRQFRSRLEARWATFFDLMGWQYEYEPFDLAGWIPDFLLIAAHESYVVEIKPVVEFPEEVADKIAASGWEGRAVILGCTIPVRSFDVDLRRGAAMGWVSGPGVWGWDDMQMVDTQPQVLASWAEAGNRVQWKAPR